MAALRRTPAWNAKAVLLAALVLCTSLLTSAPPAAAAGAPDLCSAQYAAAQAVQARISAHNAEPHEFTPEQEGAYAAYNAEAASLNAEKAKATAGYTACFDAMMALADTTGSGNLNLKDLTPTRRAQIDAGKQRLGPGWTPPPPPAPGKNWRIPLGSPLRPLFIALRAGNPGGLPYSYLKGGMKLPVGAPDPAYLPSSGRIIRANAQGGPAVSADHIVPLAELIQMPRFRELSVENMFLITRSPLNFQWLSFASNCSKQSRSVAYMTGVDPRWQASQVALESQVRSKLQAAIDQLLKSQGI